VEAEEAAIVFEPQRPPEMGFHQHVEEAFLKRAEHKHKMEYCSMCLFLLTCTFIKSHARIWDLSAKLVSVSTQNLGWLFTWNIHFDWREGNLSFFVSFSLLACVLIRAFCLLLVPNIHSKLVMCSQMLCVRIRTSKWTCLLALCSWCLRQD
jgi:hypothetical protein